MKRIPLDDGNTWFDMDRATEYQEDTRWNGNNHISVATGSQWEHQVLYRTASGLWVLHTWSQWQGSTPTFETVSEAYAYDWLTKNDHAAAVPDTELAARELGAGETPRRSIRIADDLWEAVQTKARAEGLDTSKVIVRLLAAYVQA